MFKYVKTFHPYWRSLSIVGIDEKNRKSAAGTRSRYAKSTKKAKKFCYIKFCYLLTLALFYDLLVVSFCGKKGYFRINSKGTNRLSEIEDDDL